MDTTKQNIEMCEKAEEIQAIWKKAEGFIEDAVYIPPKPKTDKDWVEEAWKDWMPCYTTSDYNYRYLNRTLDSIWLPRQDQLQIISGLSWADFDDKCRGYWLQNVGHEITKEQAGICVVMKAKYNKEWSNGEWK